MTTFTPTQIEIIKKFGRKELTEGCYISYMESGEQEILMLDSGNQYSNGKISCYLDVMGYVPDITDFEILGHEPHLEDVFRVAKEKNINLSINSYDDNKLLTIRYINNNGHEIFIHLPYNPSIPLIDQPDSTLEQLLNLK